MKQPSSYFIKVRKYIKNGYVPGAFLVWSNAQGLRAERGSDLRSDR